MRHAMVAFPLLLLGAFHAPAVERASQQPIAELTRGVDELFAEWSVPGSPGGAVVLIDGGQTILKRAYGLADIEHGVPITHTTRFELASVSKPFTAFAVLLLEKEGKLSLDDDVRDHLPELPDRGWRITVADLLHHTSGLSDWGKVRSYALQPARHGFGIADLLSLVGRQRTLEFEPGTRWSYSNTNYALLAEIVARVTDRPFGEWMQENVFAPLEMRDTSFPADGARVLPNRANAYDRESGGRLARSLVEEFEIPGPAHAFSTIDDMAKWLDNLRTGRVGGPEIVETMRKKSTLRTGEQSFYGAGLGMIDYRGVLTAGHSGRTGSFKTELVYCPDIGVGVVVVGNAGWMNASDISRRVLDLYLGDELQPLPTAAAGAGGEPREAPFIDLDPAEYERFLGGYRVETDPSALVAIAREGTHLVYVRLGKGLDVFRPVGPHEFENRIRNCRLTFFDKEGEKGTVDRLRITLRGKEMWATRVQMPRDAGWIEESIGFYYSDELGVAYEIVREPDVLAVRVRGSSGRALYPADTDVLAGGIGVLSFVRDEGGRIAGFDFGEPEDFGERLIRFVRRGECL